jgi:hypothetical protein
MYSSSEDSHEEKTSDLQNIGSQGLRATDTSTARVWL